MQKVLTIFGPTASNKTVLSLHLAKLLPGPTEIISADSVQIYKHLDIGSNKPTQEQLQQAKHHLVSYIDPSEGHINSYSAINFRNDASAILKSNQNKSNIIVGGCGYYLQHLLFDYNSPPEGSLETRISVEAKLRKEGWETSVKRLERIDPEAARSLTKFNYRRLARFLEIYAISNRKPSDFKKEPTKRYDFRGVTLIPSMTQLNDIISKRCEKMIESGLFEEVVNLITENKLKLNTGASKAIGYNDVIDFLFTAKYPVMPMDFLKFLVTFKSSNRRYASDQINFARRFFGTSFLNVSVETLLNAQNASQFEQELHSIANNVLHLYNMSMEEYEYRVSQPENSQVFDLFLEKQHINEMKQAKRLFHKKELSRNDFKHKTQQIQSSIHSLFLYRDDYVLNERVDKLNALLRRVSPLRETVNYSKFVAESKNFVTPSVVQL